MAPPPAAENYRSIGRGTGGVAVRSQNVFKRYSDINTVPTIPAKFETVLYKGNHEEKGFGSRSPRFGQEPRPDAKAPGPGAYPTGGLAVLSHQADGVTASCVGKRGNNAFASRKDRFKQRHERKPGPGAYEAAERAPGTPKSIKNAPNAAFVPHRSVNPAKFRTRVSPGPGDYADKKGPTWGEGGASFPREREASEQRVDFGIKDVPGPGAYEDGFTQESQAGRGKRHLLPLPDTDQPVKPVPDQLMKASSLLRMGADKLLEELASGELGAAQNSTSTPGPGSYEPQIAASKGRTPFGTGESSCFRAGNSQMPRKWEAPAPGPGDYDAFKKSMASGEGRSADSAAPVFASVTPRFKDSKPTAPGPAYYSPRSSRRLNQFHLNTGRGWV